MPSKRSSAEIEIFNCHFYAQHCTFCSNEFYINILFSISFKKKHMTHDECYPHWKDIVVLLLLFEQEKSPAFKCTNNQQ